MRDKGGRDLGLCKCALPKFGKNVIKWKGAQSAPFFNLHSATFTGIVP